LTKKIRETQVQKSAKLSRVKNPRRVCSCLVATEGETTSKWKSGLKIIITFSERAIVLLFSLLQFPRNMRRKKMKEVS
jgi:hypothetical protein